MIPTKRLSLVPALPAFLRAESAGRQALAEALDVGVPESWPPDLYDEQARTFVLERLDANPSEAGWWHYYIVENEPVPTLVGIAGFKGPPRDDGTVEVGYSIVPERRRQGIATEAVGALLARAFESPDVRRVVAETYPTLDGSMGVIKSLGFQPAAGATEPGVVRFELARPAAPTTEPEVT